MEVKRTFIQQTSFDGTTYTKGSVIDTLEDYHIGCMEFPFKTAPKSQALIERQWPGKDGKDVYIPPNGIPLEDYDIEVEFIYKGTVPQIGTDMSGFLDFIRGRNEGATGGRLVIYDEHVGFGRKDVAVADVDPQMYQADESDPDALFDFKVTFHVYDPSTNITVVTDNKTKKVTDLSFKIKEED